MSKHLGKITSAEFGTHRDRPFLMGLMLEFSFDGSVIGTSYMTNMGFGDYDDKDIKQFWFDTGVIIEKLIHDAGADYISELVDKPVEIELDGQTFKDFRILTEVL